MISRCLRLAVVTAATAFTFAVPGNLLGADERRWVEVRSANTLVVSDAGEATAHRVAVELERARNAIQQLAGNSMPDHGEPVVVLAVRNQNGLKELLPQFWERRGPKPAGVASPGPYTPFIALRTDLRWQTLSRLLVHEYVHILTRSMAGEPHAWLDEGLSDFWSSIRIGNGIVRVGGARNDYLNLLRSREWTPLDKLLPLERGRYGNNARATRMQYAQSWALVHYLLLGRPGTMLAFAPAVPEGDIPRLDRELKAYVSGRLPSLAKPFTPEVARIPAPSPLGLPRSLALRGLFLVHGERPAAAVSILRSALAAEPAEPLALEGLATYYFLRNDADEARGWFKRAIDAEGASYRAHYYYGLLMQETPAISEHHLRKALELNPGFAPALQRLTKPHPRAEN